MPIFEYHCRDCGQAFEAFVTGERKASCPGCQGENLAKLLSRPGMVGTAGQGRQSEPAVGGCGAGGTSCACRQGIAH